MPMPWTSYLPRARSWPNHRSIEQEEDLLSEKTTTTSEEYESSELQWQAAYEKLKRSFIIVVLLLSCIIIGILLPWHRDDGPAPARSREESMVPEIPWTKVTFARNDSFAAPSSPESDAAWGEMMPPGDGFVVIDNLLLNIPPGKSTRYGQVYDTSMWHQLHCLSHMRTYLYTLQSSLNHSNALHIFDVLLKPQSDHIAHCFDYLRQAIMCAGDLTLEWPRTEVDGRRFAVDGWGIEHVCRDWDFMAGWVEENAVGRHSHAEMEVVRGGG